MKLTCDVCFGDLMMLQGGSGAVCTKCGITYSVESLREKLGINPAAPEPTNSAENIQNESNNACTFDETVYEANYTVVNETVEEFKRLIIHRKRDLHLCKIVVIIDDGEPIVLNGMGEDTVIALSKGVHKMIVRFGSGIGVTELDEQIFEVAETDLVAEVGLYRGAFKASYGIKIWEVM